MDKEFHEIRGNKNEIHLRGVSMCTSKSFERPIRCVTKQPDRRLNYNDGKSWAY